MVKNGTMDLKNVVVVASGNYVLSSETFPEYFVKDSIGEVNIDTSFDLDIFGKYVAPRLQIKKRFVGEEPLDFITAQYNRDMRRVLPKYGIQVIEVVRKSMDDGQVISASMVRNLLKEERFEELKEIVPKTTYEYLTNMRKN